MDYIRDPNLVLDLPLYLLDGGSFADKSAYGHLCTVTEALWRPSGRYFDGTNDAIAVAYSGSLNLTGQFTVMAWVKSSESGNFQGIMGKSGTTAAAIALYRPSSNVVRLHIYDGAGYEQVDSLTNTWDGSWHHIVGTSSIQGSTKALNIYIDGNFEATSARTRTPASETDQVWGIGWYGAGGTYIEATINDVLIYSRALTPAEISHNYIASKDKYR